MSQESSETSSTDDSVVSDSDESDSDSDSDEGESETETDTISGTSFSETDDEDIGMENLELAKATLSSLGCKYIAPCISFTYCIFMFIADGSKEKGEPHSAVDKRAKDLALWLGR